MKVKRFALFELSALLLTVAFALASACALPFGSASALSSNAANATQNSGVFVNGGGNSVSVVFDPLLTLGNMADKLGEEYALDPRFEWTNPDTLPLPSVSSYPVRSLISGEVFPVTVVVSPADLRDYFDLSFNDASFVFDGATRYLSAVVSEKTDCASLGIFPSVTYIANGRTSAGVSRVTAVVSCDNFRELRLYATLAVTADNLVSGERASIFGEVENGVTVRATTARTDEKYLGLPQGFIINDAIELSVEKNGKSYALPSFADFSVMTDELVGNISDDTFIFVTGVDGSVSSLNNYSLDNGVLSFFGNRGATLLFITQTSYNDIVVIAVILLVLATGVFVLLLMIRKSDKEKKEREAKEAEEKAKALALAEEKRKESAEKRSDAETKADRNVGNNKKKKKNERKNADDNKSSSKKPDENVKSSDAEKDIDTKSKDGYDNTDDAVYGLPENDDANDGTVEQYGFDENENGLTDDFGFAEREEYSDKRANEQYLDGQYDGQTEIFDRDRRKNYETMLADDIVLDGDEDIMSFDNVNTDEFDFYGGDVGDIIKISVYVRMKGGEAIVRNKPFAPSSLCVNGKTFAMFYNRRGNKSFYMRCDYGYISNIVTYHTDGCISYSQYHMSNDWFKIVIDESWTNEQIFDLIDVCFDYTLNINGGSAK